MLLTSAAVTAAPVTEAESVWTAVSLQPPAGQVRRDTGVSTVAPLLFSRTVLVPNPFKRLVT
jgi:hypothetical protein